MASKIRLRKFVNNNDDTPRTKENIKHDEIIEIEPNLFQGNLQNINTIKLNQKLHNVGSKSQINCIFNSSVDYLKNHGNNNSDTKQDFTYTSTNYLNMNMLFKLGVNVPKYYCKRKRKYRFVETIRDGRRCKENDFKRCSNVFIRHSSLL